MAEGNHTDPPIDIFCHIPKTGGMTFHHLLRRYFGWNHLAGTPRSGWVYDAKDLQRDLRVFPHLRSLGGHSMRPFVNFGPNTKRLRWYTVLRDPVARTISNFQHQVEKNNQKASFIEWLEKPYNHNWHVRMLSGGQDLDVAKEALRRCTCIGFIDRYNEFLLLLKDRMGWKGFNPTYLQVKNPAHEGTVRQEIYDNMATYSDALSAANYLDQQLFEYANQEIYSTQVAEYGEERLTRDLNQEFATPREDRSERRRVWAFHFVNRSIYPVLVKFDQRPQTVTLND